MIKRIRAWRKKKREKKRERIAALIACIITNKTFESNQFRWLAKDIESEYVDGIFLIMKGDWEKALKLVGQIKYTPPDAINCRCGVITATINRNIVEGEVINVDMIT